MTDREAGPGATPSWLRPLGPDPDLADVAARAAVVGRMAGRVAALASDLQLLALLLQDAAGSGSHVTLPLPGEAPTCYPIPQMGDTPAGPGDALPLPGTPPSSADAPPASPQLRRDRAERPDDPFARAEAAVGALREALMPGGGSSDVPVG
jgi:hypothetical protein